MKNFAKFAALFIVPLVLIFGAVFLYLNLKNVSPAMLTIIVYVPFILFATAAAISWWFNRSRVFFCVLVMVFVYIVIRLNLAGVTDKSLNMDQIYSSIGIYISINILLFSFFKERGILTLWGVIKFSFILIQSFFLIKLIEINTGSISYFASDKFIFKDLATFEFFPQITLIIIVVTLIVLITRGIVCKSCIDMSFTTAILMTLATILLKGSDMAISIFFSFSALALIIAVIQDSYFMAFMDELTGLPSRRALKHELMKLSGRYTIAMLDIDFFKRFNDTYGHDVGDQVLKMVSSVMMNVTGGGKPFRYGGEEFTILFSGKGSSEAMPHLEELRENISKRGFTQRSKSRAKKKTKKSKLKTSGGKQLFVTVSIGIAEKNEKCRKSDEVLKAADKALYRAKKKGRNCVSK